MVYLQFKINYIHSSHPHQIPVPTLENFSPEKFSESGTVVLQFKMNYIPTNHGTIFGEFLA